MQAGKIPSRKAEIEIPEKYLRDAEVAEMIGRSVFTLRNDRHLGKGLPYIKISRQIRYPLNGVVAFLRSRTIEPEKD